MSGANTPSWGFLSFRGQFWVRVCGFGCVSGFGFGSTLQSDWRRKRRLLHTPSPSFSTLD